jgi:L-rhamnose mutarotase
MDSSAQSKTYYLALDLKQDLEGIKAYEKYHQEVWPEILESLWQSGILSCEIFRVENRLFMVLVTQVDFSFNQKASLDANNPKVQEWENLMWQYQQVIPNSKPGEKWRLLEPICHLQKPLS